MPERHVRSGTSLRASSVIVDPQMCWFQPETERWAPSISGYSYESNETLKRSGSPEAEPYDTRRERRLDNAIVSCGYWSQRATGHHRPAAREQIPPASIQTACFGSSFSLYQRVTGAHERRSP